MRSFMVAATISLLLSSSLAAQKDAPRRPKLASDADTCDAQAYFDYGMRNLERNPERAEAAFYWAGLLDPSWADPVYARRVALLLEKRGLLANYMSGSRRVLESKQVLRIDSLQYRALTMNPFLYRGLEKNLFTAYMRDIYDREARMAGEQPNYSELNFWIESHLATASPSLRAWSDYGSGRFASAVEAYALAIKWAKDKSYLHAQRGRTFFLMGEKDSALAEMRQALTALRERDKKDLVYVYESKALYEHSIGALLESKGDLAGAREAYGRALQEDMSYYPAHLRTAAVALRMGDTAAAVAAGQLAAQIRPDDPVVLAMYGELLLATKRPAEAEEPLRHATQVDADYAEPHFYLARALDAQGKAAAAVAEYRVFLERAARRNGRRARAEDRLRVLAATAAGGGA